MDSMKWTFKDALYAVTVIVTVSGIMIGAYWNVLQSINAQQVALTSYSTRLEMVEKQLAARQEEDTRFASEMRAALNSINQGIADLRVLEAQRRGK